MSPSIDFSWALSWAQTSIVTFLMPKYVLNFTSVADRRRTESDNWIRKVNHPRDRSTYFYTHEHIVDCQSREDSRLNAPQPSLGNRRIHRTAKTLVNLGIEGANNFPADYHVVFLEL